MKVNKLSIKESVAQAKAQGLTRFTHHTACVRCDTFLRQSSNHGRCVLCNKIAEAGVKMRYIMTSQEARDLGLEKFDGRPHHKCGKTLRYAANGRCIECAIEDSRRNGAKIKRAKECQA